MTKKGDPEDFVPAELEHTPNRAAAYFNSALFYEDAGDLTQAIADYLHVLDLSNDRIDVHNRLAGIYWKQKHQEDALAEWKRALQLLQLQTTTVRMQETFWGDFAATVNNLAARKLLPQFQPEVNQILHHYVKRNGSYRLDPLLLSVFPRLEGPGTASALALELSADAPDTSSFLRQFISGNSVYKLDPEPIFHRVLDLVRESVQKSEGLQREYAQQDYEGLQVRWLQYLLEQKQYDRVRDGLNALARSMWERRAELVAVQLKLAAATGGVDAVVDAYRADTEHAPAAEVLRKVATELQQAGDKQSAGKILEFVFAREVENHNLNAANMLGLADIRIQAGNLEGGLALLRRMTLVVGNAFESQDLAAALLRRTGHPAEAIAFLEDLVKATPWNSDYRVRLAEARLAANHVDAGAIKDLVSEAASANVPYATRLNAARSLSGNVPDLGSRELNLMASGQATAPADANQPFFFAARMKAMEGAPASARIGLLRAALEDNPAGDSARVPLLKAAFETGDYYLAIATMKPYIAGGNPETALEVNQGAEDPDAVSGQDWQAEGAVNAFAKLLPKEKAEIARELGLAFEKTGALNQALPFLRKAYRLETDAAVKAQINKEVQQIRLVQRRRAANQTRQPQIHSELEQQHTVRPRLPEPPVSGPPAPRGAAQKGATL